MHVFLAGCTTNSGGGEDMGITKTTHVFMDSTVRQRFRYGSFRIFPHSIRFTDEEVSHPFQTTQCVHRCC